MTLTAHITVCGLILWCFSQLVDCRAIRSTLSAGQCGHNAPLPTNMEYMYITFLEEEERNEITVDTLSTEGLTEESSSRRFCPLNYLKDDEVPT